MYWIIDGHNLVPNIPGLSLADVDDEEKLIAWLQRFLWGSRDKIELYFDKAPLGKPKTKSFGRLTAIYVDHRSIADKAIIQRCQKMGKSARQVTVVTSDHSIQTNVRALQARVMDSAAFVDFAMQRQQQSPAENPSKPALSEQEVVEWMDLFNTKPDLKP